MNKKYAIAITMLTGLAACGGAEAANTPASTPASTPAVTSAPAVAPTGPTAGPTAGPYGQGSGGYTTTPTSAVPTTAPPTSTTVPTTAPPTSTTVPTAAPAVSVVASMLGQILAGPDGNTMYGFTKDANGTPTCVGGCAKAWPPVIVDASLDLSTLPNSQLFSIVDRPDGSKQLKAGKWPLYYFSGDAAPGDTNGQGSGGSWFVVGQDAKLVK